MELLNEANAKVLAPARLFRFSGYARLPKEPFEQTKWAVPVEDDYLLGFATIAEVREKDMRLIGALDYASAARLNIEVGMPMYFHPVFYEPERVRGYNPWDANRPIPKLALDSVLVRLYPDYDGQEPITMEVL